MAVDREDALARALRATTSAHLQGTRPSSWWQRQARAILANPGPLLAALAEAGVLEAQVRDVCSCGSVRGGMWRPHNDTDDGVHDIHRERCYVTEWRPTDARS